MGSIKIAGDMRLLFLLFSLLSLKISEQCEPVTQPPPPPGPQGCTYDVWGQWTTCSRTCGGGMQARVRTVSIHAECNGADCAGEVTSSQVCNTEACEACDAVAQVQEYNLGMWKEINGQWVWEPKTETG